MCIAPHDALNSIEDFFCTSLDPAAIASSQLSHSLRFTPYSLECETIQEKNQPAASLEHAGISCIALGVGQGLEDTVLYIIYYVEG